MAIAAVIGIFLLLQAAFGSWRLAAAGLPPLPLALGGRTAGGVCGGTVSLGSLVGFLAILGIAIRNGIMLVSRYQRWSGTKVRPFGPALVLRGARSRGAPIVMSARRTGVALCRRRSRRVAGNEILHPLAWSCWADWSRRPCSTCSSFPSCTCASLQRGSRDGEPPCQWLGLRARSHGRTERSGRAERRRWNQGGAHMLVIKRGWSGPGVSMVAA